MQPTIALFGATQFTCGKGKTSTDFPQFRGF